MKNILLVAVVFISLVSKAQDCSVTFYSEVGETFYVMINGVKKNNFPISNVKVEGLSSETAYKARVSINDGSGSIITKNLYLEPNTNSSVNIKINKKGDWVMRWMGSAAAPVAQKQTYSEPSSTQTTTVTTTTSNTPIDKVKSAFSMNVNVNIDENNGNDGTTNGKVNLNSNVNTTTTTTSKKPVYQEAIARCDYPMHSTDFEAAKKSIKSKSFAESRLVIGKQIIKSGCPTSEQVRDIVKLYTFESGKLEIAKYAHDYVYDVGNYYKVNDAFTFESSIKELNEYIEGK